MHEGRFSVQSDVWSFGVVLWEIWCADSFPAHLPADAPLQELRVPAVRRHDEPGGV